VPIGNVLCAAVIPQGLNFSPDAVVLLLLHSPGFAQSYHDAKVALAGVTHAARAAMATTARILLVIALSYLCSVHQFGPYVHSLISGDHGGSQTPDLRVRSAMLYSAELTDRNLEVPRGVEPRSQGFAVPRITVLLRHQLAGDQGLEPPYGGTKDRCLIRLANLRQVYNGGRGWIRTNSVS
jgi:hypothetical protein